MFICFLVLSVINNPQPMIAADGSIVVGTHGVQHIFANKIEDAFYFAGMAAAKDRLFQMELSRRSAQGRLSEFIGREALNSDRDAIRFGYSDEEYKKMFENLSNESQKIVNAYIKGINAWIDEAYEKQILPQKFDGRKPVPWQAQDVLAITVNLVRQFGRGGAGEIRNLLLYTYFQDRLKDEAINIIEDLAWQNDKNSIPTCYPHDDPFQGESPFSEPAPNALQEHVKKLPPVNMLELLPGIRIVEQDAMKQFAQRFSLVYDWGSYAIVVAPNKSAIGVPILLSGPQMGFRSPSVVHQMSIYSENYKAVGMTVPGIPGILVGHSENGAWGVTSGVADTDDIFYVKLNPENPNQYLWKGKWENFEQQEIQIKVKDGDDVKAIRERSHYGPVVIKSISTGVAYCRKSSLWLQETEVLNCITDVARTKNAKEMHELAKRFNPSFNLFAAFNNGDIAWFFCGRIPLRSEKTDPRFPTPGDGEHDWKGILSPDKMPYAINPRDGLIVNWNNKPVNWWLNFDTPVWGKIFRNEALLNYLTSIPIYASQDLERAIYYIATHRTEPKYFVENLIKSLKENNLSNIETKALNYLENWKYDFTEGSIAPVIYESFFAELQTQLFTPKIGTFISPDMMRLALQPTLVWNAINQKTKINYLGERKPEEVYVSAFTKAINNLKQARGEDVATWRFRASRIMWENAPETLYSDRGTYIQIVELWKTPRGRFLAPPGTSENPKSPFFNNQAHLASNWTFIPMNWLPADVGMR